MLEHCFLQMWTIVTVIHVRMGEPVWMAWGGMSVSARLTSLDATVKEVGSMLLGTDARTLIISCDDFSYVLLEFSHGEKQSHFSYYCTPVSLYCTSVSFQNASRTNIVETPSWKLSFQSWIHHRSFVSSADGHPI